MSDKSSKAQLGSKNHNWRNNASSELYSLDYTETLKNSIRKRDNYTCKECGQKNVKCCHHIDYDKQNSNPNNLITLCNSCHIKTNYNREFWIKHFNL
jgi:5-methylcytosine-specific restriction endonuclease McrA